MENNKKENRKFEFLMNHRFKAGIKLCSSLELHLLERRMKMHKGTPTKNTDYQIVDGINDIPNRQKSKD